VFVEKVMWVIGDWVVVRADQKAIKSSRSSEHGELNWHPPTPHFLILTDLFRDGLLSIKMQEQSSDHFACCYQFSFEST
jgi:hypothetical protein